MMLTTSTSITTQNQQFWTVTPGLGRTRVLGPKTRPKGTKTRVFARFWALLTGLGRVRAQGPKIIKNHDF